MHGGLRANCCIWIQRFRKIILVIVHKNYIRGKLFGILVGHFCMWLMITDVIVFL